MPLSKRHRHAADMPAWPQPAAPAMSAATGDCGEAVITPRVLAVLAYLEDHQEMGAADAALARQPVIREAARRLLSESPLQPVRWLEPRDLPGDTQGSQ